jgi:hypothetical protein
MVLLARINDGAGRPIRPADVRQIDCGVREMDSSRHQTRGFVAEWRDVLLPTILKDSSWTVDDVGYNFRHDLSGIAEFAATSGSARVEVAYIFTLPNGEREMVSFYLKLG